MLGEKNMQYTRKDFQEEVSKLKRVEDLVDEYRKEDKSPDKEFVLKAFTILWEKKTTEETLRALAEQINEYIEREKDETLDLFYDLLVPYLEDIDLIVDKVKTQLVEGDIGEYEMIIAKLKDFMLGTIITPIYDKVEFVIYPRDPMQDEWSYWGWAVVDFNVE